MKRSPLRASIGPEMQEWQIKLQVASRCQTYFCFTLDHDSALQKTLHVHLAALHYSHTMFVIFTLNASLSVSKYVPCTVKSTVCNCINVVFLLVIIIVHRFQTIMVEHAYSRFLGKLDC